jgi:hypothetical protein
MWKANGKTTTLQLFLDSLSPKTEKLSLEEAMDLSRDRNEMMMTHWIGGCVDPRAGLRAREKRKISCSCRQ